MWRAFHADHSLILLAWRFLSDDHTFAARLGSGEGWDSGPARCVILPAINIYMYAHRCRKELPTRQQQRHHHAFHAVGHA